MRNMVKRMFFVYILRLRRVFYWITDGAAGRFIELQNICFSVIFVLIYFISFIFVLYFFSVMDSHQSQSSSFVHLLNNQLPNIESPTQLMSFSPTLDLGGSSSRAQGGEDRKQRVKWSTAEDLVLISAWLNTSKDPLDGNEQRAGTFWKRITAYYNASPKVVGLPKREQTHCKQRWGKINEGVCKFVGSYDAATKQRTSGQSEDDVLKAAHEIFFNDYKVKFSLEHGWRELRNDQKWCGTYESTQQSSGSKRKRVGGGENNLFRHQHLCPV
ncbi:hypothetical protein YC2023_011629 [Brassica napus]